MTPIEAVQREMQELRDRIEDLQVENRLLRRQIRGQADDALVAALKIKHPSIPPQGAWVLAALYRAPGRFVTHGGLTDNMQPQRENNETREFNQLRVVVHQIHRFVRPGLIASIRSQGYVLTEAGVKLVEAAHEPFKPRSLVLVG